MNRVILAAVVFSVGVARAAEPLGLDEIKALAAQNAWTEILEKAERVKASDRNADWNNAVTQAAAEGCDGKPSDRDPLSQVQCAQRLEKRFAFLKVEPSFQKRLKTLVTEGLDDCTSRDFNDCDARMIKLSAQLKADVLVAAGAALLKNGYFKTSPMPLFADAVKQNASHCFNTALPEVVVASLGMPAGEARAKQARAVAFGACFKALSAPLKAAMVGASDYYLKNACAGLKEKKALSELQIDLCHDAEE
jgi:hypothetical protein